MSATISLPPTAAPAAQIALSVAGAADGASAASADTAGQGSFATLFQQLASKQLSATSDADAKPLPADVLMAAATDPQAVDALAALLPFLEAMGLVQADTPDAASGLLEAKLAGADEEVDASLLAGIAPALTPQLAATSAISAAEAANRAQAGVQTALTAPLTDTQPDLAMHSAALAAAEEAASQRTPQANEFSSRFAAALETAGDKAANNTATTNPAGMTPQHAAPAAAVPALPVPQRVGAPGWSHEVGNHVVWMANRQHSHAELVMTPPQMGRVEVSLSITGDQASASFVSANPAVREALEAALPRLREVLAEAGIQLSQTQVGAENSRQSAQEDKNGDNFGFGRDPNHAQGRPLAAAETLPASAGLKIGRGLVDVFA